jgi:hypothetical protein
MTVVGAQPAAVVQKTVVSPEGPVITWTEIEWLDIVTGLPAGTQRPPQVTGRISGVPGTRQLVAEVFGANDTNLWLFAIP